MDNDIHSIYSDLVKDLANAKSVGEIFEIQTKYLGRKGKINTLLSSLKELSGDEMKTYGQKINKLKNMVKADLEQKSNELVHHSSKSKWVDTTLPGTPQPLGYQHLTTKAIREIRQIFSNLGFIQMSYPEVEWEYYAFDSLNLPPDHPARDDFEAFFIDAQGDDKMGKVVLTPHATSAQVREMKRVMGDSDIREKLVKMVNISRTYRPNWDSTHTPMFHQFDGLCIDKNINISHLKGTIEYFTKEFFGRDHKTRLRPYDFPFTEPSFEVDIHTGTDTIGRAGWLELGGAGMVHPDVLREGGFDPNEYSGWAFGFGVERAAMMKGGIVFDDLRLTYSGDVKFLKQF